MSQNARDVAPSSGRPHVESHRYCDVLCNPRNRIACITIHPCQSQRKHSRELKGKPGSTPSPFPSFPEAMAVAVAGVSLAFEPVRASTACPASLSGLRVPLSSRPNL